MRRLWLLAPIDRDNYRHGDARGNLGTSMLQGLTQGNTAARQTVLHLLLDRLAEERRGQGVGRDDHPDLDQDNP